MIFGADLYELHPPPTRLKSSVRRSSAFLIVTERQAKQRLCLALSVALRLPESTRAVTHGGNCQTLFVTLQRLKTAC